MIVVLSFLSAVALFEQGWYVPYKSLKELEQTCPLAQGTLRSLEIQAQHILCKFGRTRIWRIHPSISIKLHCGEQKATLGSSSSSNKVVVSEARQPGVDTHHVATMQNAETF